MGDELARAVWTQKFIDDLPDASFAFIEAGGAKDADGKTTPRSLRHLPFADASGKPDAAHVRNALARLSQTKIPAAAKAAAKKKLAAAAKKLGIEVSDDDEGRVTPAAKVTRSMGEEQAQALFYAPITRIDKEKREVEGWMSSERIDGHGTVFDYDAMKSAVGEWPGNIREMHQLRAVGRRVKVDFDDDNRRVRLRARISKGADDTWEKVCDGTLGGFSIGAYDAEAEIRRVGDQDVPWYKRFKLGEVSLVDVPSNPDAAEGLTVYRSALVNRAGEAQEALGEMDAEEMDAEPEAAASETPAAEAVNPEAPGEAVATRAASEAVAESEPATPAADAQSVAAGAPANKQPAPAAASEPEAPAQPAAPRLTAQGEIAAPGPAHEPAAPAPTRAVATPEPPQVPAVLAQATSGHLNERQMARLARIMPKAVIEAAQQASAGVVDAQGRTRSIPNITMHDPTDEEAAELERQMAAHRGQPAPVVAAVATPAVTRAAAPETPAVPAEPAADNIRARFPEEARISAKGGGVVLPSDLRAAYANVAQQGGSNAGSDDPMTKETGNSHSPHTHAHGDNYGDMHLHNHEHEHEDGTVHAHPHSHVHDHHDHYTLTAGGEHSHEHCHTHDHEHYYRSLGNGQRAFGFKRFAPDLSRRAEPMPGEGAAVTATTAGSGAQTAQATQTDAVRAAAHGPFSGKHSHAHPAFGSQGGDDEHEHEHSHDNDAKHDHHSGDDASDRSQPTATVVATRAATATPVQPAVAQAHSHEHQHTLSGDEIVCRRCVEWLECPQCRASADAAQIAEMDAMLSDLKAAELQRAGARVSAATRAQLHTARDATLRACGCDDCQDMLSVIDPDGDGDDDLDPSLDTDNDADNDGSDPDRRAPREPVHGERLARVLVKRMVREALRAELAPVQQSTARLQALVTRLTMIEKSGPTSVQNRAQSSDVQAVQSAEVTRLADQVEAIRSAQAEVLALVQAIANQPQPGGPVTRAVEKYLVTDSRIALDGSAGPAGAQPTDPAALARMLAAAGIALTQEQQIALGSQMIARQQAEAALAQQRYARGE